LVTLTLVHLRAHAQGIDAPKLVSRFLALIQATFALGAVGLATILHGFLAPGDMTWLGTPLLVGTGILAIGVMLRLAYVLQDAQQRFEDQGIIISRTGASDA